MWSSKRPEAPQAPKPEPRSFQTNQPINPPQAIPSKGEVAHGSVAMGDSIVARLGPSLQVKGEISGSEDLCIDGQVKGSIRLQGRKLIIGSTARVVLLDLHPFFRARVPFEVTAHHHLARGDTVDRCAPTRTSSHSLPPRGLHAASPLGTAGSAE